MTPFEKKFIGCLLTTLNAILSDKKELEDALKGYTQGDSTHTRHKLNSQITDILEWNQSELRQFNAAHSEAVFRVMGSYKDDETIIHEINKTLELFREGYIRKLTANTRKGDRINSVRTNIARIKEEEFSTEEELSVNPFSFFSPELTAGLVATAAAAVFLLARSRATP